MRKRKVQPSKTPLVIEPIRRTLLDVVNENLKTLQRNIFLHRYYFIGEYQSSDPSEFVDLFESNINTINKGYCDETISGYLLYYNRYFCLVLESSESSLRRHFTSMTTNQKFKEMINKIKLITIIPHINQRISKVWMSYYGLPAVCIDQFDSSCAIEIFLRHVRNCVTKLYELGNVLTKRFDDLTHISVDDEEDVTIGTGSDKARDHLKEYLPEVKLLEFLLGSKYLANFEYRVGPGTGGAIDIVPNYNDHAWPAPTNFIPYNMFDKPQDAVQDLPVPETASEKSQDITLGESSGATTPSEQA